MDLDTALTGKPAEGTSATDILRADHREARRLFDEQRRANADDHAGRVLAQALCMQLELHDRIERDVLYPVLQQVDPDAAAEAVEAHDEIAAAVERLRQRADAGDRLAEAVPQLQAIVDRHVRDEEDRLFPRLEAEKGISLVELGRELIKRKEELTRATGAFEAPAT
jgi:hemerythrin superfamily protein